MEAFSTVQPCWEQLVSLVCFSLIDQNLSELFGLCSIDHVEFTASKYNLFASDISKGAEGAKLCLVKVFMPGGDVTHFLL